MIGSLITEMFITRKRRMYEQEHAIYYMNTNMLEVRLGITLLANVYAHLV